ncbi:MAG: autotransporter domain-containing protein, partial [Armatimonadetes bacterium]|nr:autotransporter domain-containing protein [Armatimonadota bacterium]
QSHGILVQSIGGGGGTGGFSASGALSKGTNSKDLAVSLGGFGGAGGDAGAVTVTNSGHIATLAGFSGFIDPDEVAEEPSLDPIGAYSYGAVGILAQSIGGGGGNGGFAFAGAVGGTEGKSLAVSMGGFGGAGGIGSDVTVTNDGIIDTVGTQSTGILAQSIGGGGGNGGSSMSLGAGFGGGKDTYNVNAAVSIGGVGGAGNVAGNVAVTNNAAITTRGDDSYGILAQSIGGGGGNGGGGFAVTVARGAANQGHSIDANISIGGQGGDGNTAGTVDVTNTAAIATLGNISDGIRAQSIGGGGGNGGTARTLAILLKQGSSKLEEGQNAGSNWKLQAAIGGNGGTGNDAGAVTVNNSGTIYTEGACSNGIFAQSVGAGGGAGGDGILGTGTKADGPWAILGLLLEESGGGGNFIAKKIGGQMRDLSLIVGGDQGASGNAQAVTVNNSGDILTRGNASVGILAQSVGGGGGLARSFAQGEDSAGKSVIGATGKFGIGGSGGAAGDGAAVTVTNSARIDTFGDGAHGIEAQSVGGGGGIAGNVDRCLADVFGFAGIGLGLAIGGDGGGGGNGGAVSVTSDGDIETRGIAACGIYAQSVGGGGGVSGNNGYGINFSGSVGAAGDAGDVTVVANGNITTAGPATVGEEGTTDYSKGSHGIFAQSVGGDGLGGNVTITVTGHIIATGQDSCGIVAQSLGLQGQGDINITVAEGASVAGGTGEHIGAIVLVDGNNNTVNNYGTIISLMGPDGIAVLGNGTIATVNNYGYMVGNVEMNIEADTVQGASATARIRPAVVVTQQLNNNEGCLVESGNIIDLNGGLFTNAGTLAPGGDAAFKQTQLTGSYVQTDTGHFDLQVDLSNPGNQDALNATGSVQLAGAVDLSLLNPGAVQTGHRDGVLFSGNAPIDLSALQFNHPISAVVGFALANGTNNVLLSTNVDFAPGGMAPNQTQIGDCFNRIQTPGQTTPMSGVVAELVGLPTTGELAAAYDQLSPAAHDSATRATLDTTRTTVGNLLQHLQRARSAPTTQVVPTAMGDGSAPRRPRENAFWVDRFVMDGSQDPTPGLPGYSFDLKSNGMAYEHQLGERWTAGAAFVQNSLDLSIDIGPAVASVSSKLGALYAEYLGRKYYLEGAVAIGSHKFDLTRDLTVGSIFRTATSHHNGNSFTGVLTAGMYKRMGSVNMDPYASLYYTTLNEDRFQETGADAVDLIVNNRSAATLASELGVRVSCVIPSGRSVFIPELLLAWNHEWSGSNHLSAAFEGAPGELLTIGCRDQGDRFRLAAGVTFTSHSLSVAGQYFAEFGSGYDNHGGQASVFVAF